MDVEIAVGQAPSERMLKQQQRNREPQYQPKRLDPAHPHTAADVERPERERKMDGKRAVERHGTCEAAPDPFLYLGALLHRLEGDVAQTVIEKMQEEVG